MPGAVQVAPDGRRIAYGVSETDWDDNSVIQHLYVTTTDEGAVPRQVTRGADSESNPRWSPDGNWLAFVAARDEPADPDDYDDDEDAKDQVYLLPMDGGGGEPEKLTSAPEGVGAYEWLPDSTGIVYLAREPRPKPLQTAHLDKQDRKDDAVVERLERFRSQIWRIDRDDKKAGLVHGGDFGIGEIAISPDGRLAAFTTNYTGEVNDYHKADIWTVDLREGATRQLTDGPGGKFHPVWSPDSQRVLFVQPFDSALSYSQANLYAVSVSDLHIVNLTENFPHDLVGWRGVWHNAAGQLFVSVSLGTTTAIYRSADAAFEPIIESDEHIHNFHVAPDGGIAFVASGTADVPELLWLAAGATEPIVLTDLNQAWAEKYALAPTELVSWTSNDGLNIEGLLTYPLDYQEGCSYPLVLALHGGPHGRSLQALSPFTVAQVYAAYGYAVLSPNYRGSDGYGNEFGTANQNDLGGGDYRDVLAGVDWAIAEGIADPEKLAVIGSSYGGFLTNWIIGHTNRFKAAVSEFGIFSLVTDFSNSQAPRWETEYLNGYPWDCEEAYAAQSPATYVKNINTPVLILHGESDGNTFIANSQEMYTALRLQDKTVQYAHYPREGHGFSEPEHRLDEMRRCLAWFDKYLRAGDDSAIYRIGDKIVRDGWELTVAHAAIVAYVGRSEDKSRYVEIAFVLRDTLESGRLINISPSDLAFQRSSATTRRNIRPIGLPVEVLGEKVLAEGTGWKFAFAPKASDESESERGLTVPLAATFKTSNAGGEYQFFVKDFPPVTMDVPGMDKKARKDGKKSVEHSVQNEGEAS